MYDSTLTSPAAVIVGLCESVLINMIDNDRDVKAACEVLRFDAMPELEILGVC